MVWYLFLERQSVEQGRMRPVDDSLVGISFCSSLSFLQCSDMVDFLTGKASGALKPSLAVLEDLAQLEVMKESQLNRHGE